MNSQLKWIGSLLLFCLGTTLGVVNLQNLGCLSPSSQVLQPQTVRREQLGPSFFQPLVERLLDNLQRGKPSFLVVIGPEASGKTTFRDWFMQEVTRYLQHLPDGPAVKIRPSSGQDRWFLDYARRPGRETPEKFSIPEGMFGVRDLLTAREQGVFYAPFFYQTTRRRQRLIDETPFVDNKGWVNETEFAKVVQLHVGQILKSGGRLIQHQTNTLIQLYGEDGNILLKDPPLVQEVEAQVRRLQQEHPEGSHIIKKNIFVDISIDPITGFMKGDLVERIDPHHTLFFLDGILMASDQFFSPEEKERLYDLIIYLEVPEEIRTNRAVVRHLKKGRHTFLPPEEFTRQFRDRIESEGRRWVEPSKPYAHAIVRNYSDMETIPLHEDFGSLPIPVQYFFMHEILYGGGLERFHEIDLSNTQKEHIIGILREAHLFNGDLSDEEKQRLGSTIGESYVKLEKAL